MSLRTATEIKARITAIEAAIDAVLLGQSYTLDTGQGRQTVTRADLPGLEKMLQRWESLYEKAVAEESGDTGILSLQFRRNG